MKSEILKRFEISTEILSLLPKTTKDEKVLFINEAMKTYANYNLIKMQIIEEVKQRKKSIEHTLNQETTPEVIFGDSLESMNLITKINTPYEKLKLDRSLFGLKKYYKVNLTDVNNYIFDSLDIFERVGITLKEEDFFYDDFEKAYMKELINVDRDNYSIDVLKNLFEEYYWKSPNIISYIQLNFKSLYFKNIRVFNKYIDTLSKEKQQTMESLILECKNKKIEKDNIINSSAKHFVGLFIKDKLLLKDYSKINISKIAGTLFDGDIFLKEKSIVNLNRTLKEYKYYLKYKYLVEEIKKEVQGKGKEKINSKIKLKEINKLESQLLKANKKKGVSKDEIVEKIKDAYEEYNNLYFKEKLFEHINNGSKMLDALKFVMAYYEYFIKLNKQNDEEKKMNEVAKELEELELFAGSPYNTIINNIDIMGEYDVSKVVLDRYKLDNIKITFDSLEEDSLDTLIKNTDILCNYYRINKLEIINMDKIEEYYKINYMLKEGDINIHNRRKIVYN